MRSKEKPSSLARTGRLGLPVLAAGLLASTLFTAPASAALLDQPPKLYTFKLDEPSAPKLGLLRSFLNAEIERPGPMRRYLWGPFGQWKPWVELAWRPLQKEPSDPESEALPGNEDLPRATAMLVSLLDGDRSPEQELFFFGVRSRDRSELLRLEPAVLPAWTGLDPSRAPALLASTGPSFVSNGFDSLWAPPPKPVRDWRCRRRAVIFVRQSGERDVFPLVRCDGSVAPEALDRLSIMMRPPDVRRSGEVLPDEPEPEAMAKGEWIADIRLTNPRLLWVLQRLADAFPWRPIYIYSGYRPGALVAGTTHSSMHSAARAVDIQVHGIPNATVFQLCRSLEDVGCGFYPNSKFVHVDVRRPGTGHAVWIDASGPGEPPRYVDSWPGVLDSGGMVWAPALHRGAPGGAEWSTPRLPSGSSVPAPPRYGGLP